MKTELTILQSWWFRREPPSWLTDARHSTRAWRASLLLGVRGALSGIATGLTFALFRYVPGLSGLRVWGEAELGGVWLAFGPGLVFGVITLVPLSRWHGRGWGMTLLAIPVSMGAYWCGIVAYFTMDPIGFGPGSGAMNHSPFLGGLLAGAVGASILAVWMGHPKQEPAWLSFAATTGLATLGCGLWCLTAGTHSHQGGFITTAMLFLSFQVPAAVGLGVRLWWPKSAKPISSQP